MDSQEIRLVPPSVPARQMLLPAQGPEAEPAGAPARTAVRAQVTPGEVGAGALPLLLVLPVILLSPLIFDLLFRLRALFR